jgi:hypothetical protein
MTFVPLYDLEALTEAQRQDYVKAVCEHMGIPSNLNLIMLTYLDEQDGPRRLVAYAKRGATELIRNHRFINVTNMESKQIGGSVVFTVTGKDGEGRQEMSTGSKFIEGLTGRELDDAIMTAQTRATRRMTLQFVGAGVLDESEVNPKLVVETKNTTTIAIPTQPSVQASAVPGADITLPKTEPEALETHIAEQAKLREDAIDFLNAEKPVRKTRKRKNAVDLGPSTNPVPETVPTPVPFTVSTNQSVNQIPVNNWHNSTQPMQQSKPVPPMPVLKPKLSPEVIKPYRQRQFKFITDLETAGFAPTEGKGNLDKMRDFVSLMFPEVTNFNELSVEQWEKYLTVIESKLSTYGPAATIKFIEESIGV